MILRLLVFLLLLVVQPSLAVCGTPKLHLDWTDNEILNDNFMKIDSCLGNLVVNDPGCVSGTAATFLQANQDATITGNWTFNTLTNFADGVDITGGLNLGSSVTGGGSAIRWLGSMDPTGGTDEGSVVQNAITHYCNTGLGGTIVIPPGTYKFTDRLLITSCPGVTIAGAGDATVLQQTTWSKDYGGGPTGTPLFEIGASDNVTIRDLKIMNTGTPSVIGNTYQGQPGRQHGSAVYIYDSHRTRVRGVSMDGWNGGVTNRGFLDNVTLASNLAVRDLDVANVDQGVLAQATSGLRIAHVRGYTRDTQNQPTHLIYIPGSVISQGASITDVTCVHPTAFTPGCAESTAVQVKECNGCSVNGVRTIYGAGLLSVDGVTDSSFSHLHSIADYGGSPVSIIANSPSKRNRFTNILIDQTGDGMCTGAGAPATCCTGRHVGPCTLVNLCQAGIFNSTVFTGGNFTGCTGTATGSGVDYQYGLALGEAVAGDTQDNTFDDVTIIKNMGADGADWSGLHHGAVEVRGTHNIFSNFNIIYRDANNHIGFRFTAGSTHEVHNSTCQGCGLSVTAPFGGVTWMAQLTGPFVNGLTAAQLNAIVSQPLDGSSIPCKGCKDATTCVDSGGGSTGAMARRVNGVWQCASTVPPIPCSAIITPTGQVGPAAIPTGAAGTGAGASDWTWIPTVAGEVRCGEWPANCSMSAIIKLSMQLTVGVASSQIAMAVYSLDGQTKLADSTVLDGNPGGVKLVQSGVLTGSAIAQATNYISCFSTSTAATLRARVIPGIGLASISTGHVVHFVATPEVAQFNANCTANVTPYACCTGNLTGTCTGMPATITVPTTGSSEIPAGLIVVSGTPAT